MRVLLVRPRRLNAMTVFGAVDCEPLELEYLSAACKAMGAQPVLYDGILEHRPFSRVVREVRPDWVGLTGYLTQEREMAEYIRLARMAAPGCRVVVGGVHAQLNWDRLRWEGVDFILRGESTAAFQALLSRADPAGIPGLCWRTGEGWSETPYIPCDIDELPLPDRSGWAAGAKWFRYLDYPRVSTLKTAVACPYTCDFCYGRNLHGGRYQARRLDLVLDELEAIPGEPVFIVDSDFLLEEVRTEAFLRGLEERGIRKQFICYARADFIAAHPELTARLCRAGFRCFLVGIEGVRDDRLEGWNKGTSRAVNEACVTILHANGADCAALLLADPAFEKADFQALARWVEEHPVRYASVQILTPIPPTPFYRRKEGELTSRDLRQWDLTHLVLPPEHMSRRAFLARYRLLLARLTLCTWRRGAFRFVTPAYLGRVLVRWWRRRGALR